MQVDFKFNVSYYYMWILSIMYYYYMNMVRFVLKVTSRTMPYVVYDVKRISIENNDVQNVNEDYFNRRLPVCKEDMYLEYTVMFNDKMYKLISTNNKPLEPCLSLFQKPLGMSTKPRIICASYSTNGGIKKDVLHNVFQFAGPKHDFFGQDCKIQWLFQQMTKDDSLDMIYSNGKCVTYKMNDHVEHI